MAFNKAPSQSTYQTKDVKFIYSLNNRDASLTKDVIAQNGFFDLIKDKTTKDEDYQFVKRDGTLNYTYALAETNIRGVYYWEDEDKLFIAYDDQVAIVVGSTGVFSATVSPYTSTTGPVGFTEFYYDDGSTKVVVGDGVKLATIDSSNTMVVSTSADLPAFEPNVVFLDGYLFLIKEGTSDMYNSNLNDPLLWTAGDFLTAEMLPDTLIRISRLNNYLIALGSASVEYFFDAGNAEGSPLQRNDTPVKQVGYLGGYASHSNQVFFVGQTANTSPEVYMLEDFKMEMISSTPLRRFLQGHTMFTAVVMTNNSRDFYVVSTSAATFAMDLETKVWTRWSYRTDATFPVAYSVNVPVSTHGNVAVFALTGKEGMFMAVPTATQDAGVSYPVVVQTERETFDTLHKKYAARMIVYADRTAASIDVSWSDDDFQTFSTPRSVSLNSDFPVLHRLGKFVSRSFKVTYTGNQKLRMRHLEFDYNIGGR
jgi:hypothetical protein